MPYITAKADRRSISPQQAGNKYNTIKIMTAQMCSSIVISSFDKSPIPTKVCE